LPAGQAREVAELHELGGLLVVALQVLNSLIERNQFAGAALADHHALVQGNALAVAAVLGRGLAAGAVDQDAVHRLGGGEFGRTIYSQGNLTATDHGRDYHGRCFTTWFAGGGVKSGVTDDFSYNIVENPVHIRDLNATILHCLGIDHRCLTFRYQGLDQRLTSAEEARVVNEISA